MTKEELTEILNKHEKWLFHCEKVELLEVVRGG